ncbi:MAG: YncE family protein [Gemmatimonadota bacterium]
MNDRLGRILLGATALTFLGLSSPLPAQTPGDPGYHVIKRVRLGGEGGWDYLVADTVGRRLYVSHSSHVMVLDLDSLDVVGDIPNTAGVHGIAIASRLGRGFTSNGRDTTVTIFDLTTLATLGSVKVTGANPDAITFDSASGRVFTFNGRGQNSTVIDAGTAKVVGTIELGGKPEFAVTDGQGNLYVNLEDRSSLVAIDTRAMKVLHTWSLVPCESPSGLAIDLAHHRLFAGCDNKMMAILNLETGHVIATPAIGEGVDANRFDPVHQLAFSSNGEGSLTIVREISPDSFAVVANVPTQRGARTMELDARNGRLFLPTAEFGTPPAATPEQPRPRAPMVPNSFTLLVVGR